MLVVECNSLIKNSIYSSLPLCICIHVTYLFYSFVGDHCEIHLLNTTCADYPCLNGGQCFNDSIIGYVCVCADGYTGLNCETELPPPCPPDFYGPACLVFCQARDDCQGHYTCGEDGSRMCLSDWGGSLCTDFVGDQTLECPGGSATQCANGGTCFNSACCCAIGWEGPNCQVPSNPCQSNPCLNGGTCNNFQGYFQCDCVEGKCQTHIFKSSTNKLYKIAWWTEHASVEGIIITYTCTL